MQAGADTGGDGGDASPHQIERGLDMTLDFIENHRQKYFCTAHYFVAKDTRNKLELAISQKRFFGSLDELALFVEPDIK